MANFWIYAGTIPNDAVLVAATIGGQTLKRKGAAYYVRTTSRVSGINVGAAVTAAFTALSNAALDVPANTPVINLNYRIYQNGRYLTQQVIRRLIPQGQVIGPASKQPTVGAYFGRPGQFLGWYDDTGRIR